MDAGQVVEKILAQATAEAEKTLAEAKKKASTQQAKLDTELTEFRKHTETLAAEAGEDKKSRILAMARMNIRKDLLAAKVKLLDEIFTRARQQIASMPDDQYRQLIIDLMTAAIESGDEQVIVGHNETRIDHKLIKEVNRKMGPGYKGNLLMANEKTDIDAGFILKRGKIQVNVSADVLIAKAREELEMELSGELFED